MFKRTVGLIGLGLLLAGQSLAQPGVAGMDWDWDGQLYVILENGDIQLRAYRVEGSFEWFKPIPRGNFWATTTDTLEVDARIVGLEFCGFGDIPPDALSMLRNGTFLVLLDDGRFFQRAAIDDSSGFRLADGPPVERARLRLPR